MKRTLSMTEKELERMKVLQMSKEKRLTQKAGAERLGISERHFRRLLSKQEKYGDEGLISGHRGKASNNQLKATKRKEILELLRTKYQGFGATLASEKLAELEKIKVSKETVRQILIEEGYHKPKVKKKEKAQPFRERRASYGELVQIDGSYHAWLEERAAKACLLLFVDDATSQALAGEFVAHETYFSYGALCKQYFGDKGLPQAFYSDRFSVFRVNTKNVTTTDAITQFGRALKELDIHLICANSPQAKGRVERANQTFQDRLVKEMRLQHINDYQHANQFLPIFINHYNQKFGVQPRSDIDLHRPIMEHSDMDTIFAWQTKRIISKDLSIQFDNTIYQVISTRPAYTLKNREVLVAKFPDEKIAVLLNGVPLEVRPFHRQPKQADVVSAKNLQIAHIPSENHPWRNYGQKFNGLPISSLD